MRSKARSRQSRRASVRPSASSSATARTVKRKVLTMAARAVGSAGDAGVVGEAGEAAAARAQEVVVEEAVPEPLQQRQAGDQEDIEGGRQEAAEVEEPAPRGQGRERCAQSKFRAHTSRSRGSASASSATACTFGQCRANQGRRGRQRVITAR